MVKLAIIEDEEDILAVTQKIINDYCPFVTICGTASDMNSAKELLMNSKPDVALMDIKLVPPGRLISIRATSSY